MLRALLAVSVLVMAGCMQTDGGPDLDVQVYNDSAEDVEVRFRATLAAHGQVVLDVTTLVPPGYSILGHLQGPRGEYHLEAWAFGDHAEVGPIKLASTRHCSVYVRNPDPVGIDCVA